MASGIDGGQVPTLCITEHRQRVLALPRGSRPRIVGHLWLAWLSHIRKCQQYGLIRHTDDCPQYKNMNALDAAFPRWDCCDTHKKLLEVRRRLIERAEKLELYTAPHQSHEVLTRTWWLFLGYQFRPTWRVILRTPTQR